MENAPSMWSRPLDASECYFHRFDRDSSANIFVSIDWRGTFDLDRLREALDFVQKEDRLLNVEIVPLLNIYEFSEVKESYISLRVVNCPNVQWDDAIAKSMALPFPERQAPLARALVFYDASIGKSSLVIILHHAISDGRCIISLLLRILDRMALSKENLPSPTRHTDFSPLHHRFPKEMQWTNNPSGLKNLFRSFLAEAAISGPSEFLPFFGSPHKEKKPRIERLSIDRFAWKRLLTSVKANGVTVHSLFGAMQLLAIHEIAGFTKESNHLLTSAVDLRDRLSEPASTFPIHLHASNIFSMHAIGPSTNVWDLAKAIAKKTKLQLERGDAHSFFSTRETAKALQSAVESTHFEDLMARVPLGSVVSSLGLVSGFEAHKNALALTAGMCSTRSHAVFCTVTSLGDSTTILIIHDEKNLLPGVGRRIANQMQILMDQLVIAS